MAAVRLRQVEGEYEGRVRVRTRAFPLELLGRQAAPRALLAEEWWLAAVQEPAAKFSAFTSDDWPTTTLPAFIAVRAVADEDEHLAHTLDLRVREAFFAESRNIGTPGVLLDLVREIGGDVAHVERALTGDAVREQVIQEAEEGRTRYGVRGTPTLMLEDGTRVRLPIALPRIEGGRIVAVGRQTCIGEACREATRVVFEQALQHQSVAGGTAHASQR
ncbi:MAG TPA: DsbA family protein [Gemmatimonadaceae bacterium]